MKYKRPSLNIVLSPQEKRAFMSDYLQYYKDLYAKDPSAINRKIPREAFDDLIDDIGSLILKKLCQLQKHKPVFKFLTENPLPLSMQKLLTKEMRTFCLVLNALKQWLSAEQSAMDRLILGGQAKRFCREAMPKCLILGEKSGVLHHPVRDGRPPLYISIQGHKSIEERGTSECDMPNTNEGRIKFIRKETHQSWKNLLKASKSLQGKAHKSFGTANVEGSAKSVCRRIMVQTGYNFSALEKFFESKC